MSLKSWAEGLLPGLMTGTGWGRAIGLKSGLLPWQRQAHHECDDPGGEGVVTVSPAGRAARFTPANPYYGNGKVQVQVQPPFEGREGHEGPLIVEYTLEP